jgi:hypothetical protein
MKASKLALLICVFCFSCVESSAQTPASTPILGPDLTDNRRRIQEAFEHGGNFRRSEPRVIKSGLLAPSPQDIEAHKDFLSQKNTGLIRLLPRGAYNIKLRGGGAYYSFSRKTHEYGWGSDIQLDIGLLSTGFAGADFGILTNLGDVAIDSLNLEDGRVGYLADYKPPSKEKDARAEYARATRGFTRYEMLYARLAVAEVNCTYLLRSVNYDRSDVLVAFRVARIDTSDDSIIIAWKLLKKYSTPNLSR